MGSSPYTNAQALGERIEFPYGGTSDPSFRRFIIREKVSVNAVTAQQTLSQTLPARSKVLWASIRNGGIFATSSNTVPSTSTNPSTVTTFSYGTNSTVTANAVCLLAMTNTNTSVATNATNASVALTNGGNILCVGGTNTASNTVVAAGYGTNMNMSQLQNAQSVAASLILIPCNNSNGTSTGGISVSSTATNGMFFGTAATPTNYAYTYDVEVCVETYTDAVD